VDLSAARGVNPAALKLAKANPKTLPPSNIERPSSWPDYDPTYMDDDIPF
jgi:hypothetical protein